MNDVRIRQRAHLDRALRAERFLLFKHSFRCGISKTAFRAFEAYVTAHPDVLHGWIDVVADRPLSRTVEQETGVRHASPQAILIAAGRTLWSATHFDITEEALEKALSA